MCSMYLYVFRRRTQATSVTVGCVDPLMFSLGFRHVAWSPAGVLTLAYLKAAKSAGKGNFHVYQSCWCQRASTGIND